MLWKPMVNFLHFTLGEERSHKFGLCLFGYIPNWFIWLLVKWRIL